MSTYKLHYFDVRARGEPIRLLLHYAKVSFEDVRIPRPEWAAIKTKFPFGQVPVLEVDGHQIAQTQTILRYLANKFGLAGKDELDAAYIDQTVELYREYVDASSPFISVSLGFAQGDKDEVRKNKLLPALEKYAPYFKKALDKTGSGFYGKSVSYADFYISEAIDTLHGLEKELLESKYPWLVEHSKRVHALPELQDYLSKRKVSAI